jgi:hypothetical protein
MKVLSLVLFIFIFILAGLSAIFSSMVDAHFFNILIMLVSLAGIVIALSKEINNSAVMIVISLLKKIKKRKKIVNTTVFILSLEEMEKCAGQYVCIPNFDVFNVISHNADPSVARREAQEMGYKDPVIFYVPNNVEHFCYAANF